MSNILIDPKQHIDRKAEKELFENLLKLADDARVLAIRDKGGMGKSSLLKVFEYQCAWGVPQIPCSLTVLGQLDDHSDFGLVAKIRGDLTGVPFDRFDTLDYHRIARDFSRFAPTASRATGAAQVSSVTGGVVAGSVGQVVQGGLTVEGDLNVVDRETREWTPEHESRARTQCVEAFFDDLRDVSAELPVVIILDAFEHCREPLSSWLLMHLLRTRVFDPHRACPGVIVVIAGREVPNLQALPQQVYDRFVRSIGSLSAWDQEHVRDFLVLHGVDPPSDMDVKYLQEKLADGLSLVAAIMLVDALKVQAG